MGTQLKKFVYIGLGFLFVGIGVVGVVLPVLPTTPFLLLASFFFTRGSERFNNWFMSTKLYKDYLESFVKTRSMELKTKVKLLSFASIMLVLSAYMVNIKPFRIFIALLMAYKYYYFVFNIKTVKPEKKGEILVEEANEA